MTNKRTEKSRYKSPSTGDYCTAAQYIAEMMCQRMAENNNEGSLAYKFWNTEKWKKTYAHQVILANRLIKKYDERAVVKALQSSQGIKIYSLRFPKLIRLIEAEETVLKKNEASIDRVNYENLNNPTRLPLKPFGKPNKISKLRKLDG